MTDAPHVSVWREVGLWLVLGSLLLNLAFVTEHIALLWLNVRQPLPAAFVLPPGFEVAPCTLPPKVKP